MVVASFLAGMMTSARNEAARTASSEDSISLGESVQGACEVTRPP